MLSGSSSGPIAVGRTVNCSTGPSMRRPPELTAATTAGSASQTRTSCPSLTRPAATVAPIAPHPSTRYLMGETLLVRRPGVRARVEVRDESRAGGCPAEKLPCRVARHREIHAEEGADPPKMTLDIVRGDRCGGKPEGAADSLRDIARGYALFRDSVQASAGRSLREPKGDEARGVGPVHGGPPVGPVSGVTGDALFAGHCGDRRDEPVVAGSVHGRREAQAHGVHAAADEVEREILAAAARRVRAMERGRVVFRCRPALDEAGDARSEQEGAIGADECVADGLDGGSLGRGRGGRVGPIVLVGEMDDGFGGLGPSTDAGEIVEVTAADLSPLGLEGGGGGVGPGEPGDLMPGLKQLIDGSGTDPSRGSCDENTHGTVSLPLRHAERLMR